MKLSAVMVAYHKVFESDEIQVSIRYDFGEWHVQSLNVRNGRKSTAAFTTEQMDRIVAGWPQIRAQALE